MIRELMAVTAKTIIFVVCMCAVLGVPPVQSTTNECTVLLPELVDKCPAFQFLKESVERIPTEPLVVAQDSRNDLLNSIQYAYFSDACCDVLGRLDDSRCFCETDVMDILQANLHSELLKTALTSSARPTPAGCGRAVAISMKGGSCEPIETKTEGPADSKLQGPGLVQKQDGRSNPARDLSGENSGCKNGNTIFKILADFDQAFGKIIDFASTNDNVRQLLEGPGPITMFAPINLDDAAAEDIEATINRHIILGNFPAKKLRPGKSQLSSNGEKLAFSKSSGQRFVNGVQIMQKNIEACNGWVHVVERPLPSQGQTQATPQPSSQSNSGAVPPPTLSEILGNRPKSNAQTAACDCSKDGIVNGVDTGRAGCGQHLLEFDMNILFCYLEDGKACEDTSAVDVSVSSEFDGVSWRACTLDETEDLPLLQRLISKDVKTLQLGWSLLKRAEALQESGPYTVFVPSKLAIETAVLNIDQGDMASAERKMKALARNHIVAGNLTMEALIAKQESQEKTLITLEGTPLMLSKEADGRLAIGASTHIDISDLFASNGVAHVVDKVIVDGINEGKPQKPELQAPQLTRPASVPVRSPPKRPVTPTSTVGSQTGSQAALPAAPAVTRPFVVGGKLPVQPAVKPPTGSGQTLLPAGNPLIRPAAGAGALPKRNNPCECSKDGMSGGVQTGRPGCKQHVKGERFFCYVKDPANCPVAQASDGFPGAKIVPCADPCSCSATGKSGDVQTSFRGCAKHVPGEPKLCYVIDPEKCQKGRRSESFPGAEWRYCQDDENVKRRSSEPKPKTKREATDPCACSKDGVSGGVDTGKKGCGRYGALGLGFVCFVVEPSNCLLAVPSIRYSGASWRIC